MASTHFRKLDEESRALAERWDQVARVSVIVALVATSVWAVCAALRAGVHHASHAVIHAAETGGLAGGALLLGALLAGALVRALLYRREAWADASGDGMQVALDNYHVTYVHEGDDPGPRYERPDFGLAARKAVTTLLTLGSGASGGLEAPSVLVSECVSSGLSRVLRVRSEHELRTYQLAGIAAGVSTLLSAPFTAALFAAEVAYGDRFIYRKLAYGLWAGVIAFWLDTWLRGTYEPLFRAPVHEPLYSVSEYVAAALVAVLVSGPLALGFGRAILATRALVDRAGRAIVRSSSIVIAGLLALALHRFLGIAPEHVLGMGEGTLEGILGHDPAVSSASVLAIVLAAKAIATGLTITAGGSAGLLVPSMALGGISGALTAHLVTATGVATLDPALYAVVGIASSLVAVVGVPLAAIALVFEVFGRVFGPPAILACGLTYLMTLKIKVYEAQKTSDEEEDEGEGAAEEPANAKEANAPPPAGG